MVAVLFFSFKFKKFQLHSSEMGRSHYPEPSQRCEWYKGLAHQFPGGQPQSDEHSAQSVAQFAASVHSGEWSLLFMVHM